MTNVWRNMKVSEIQPMLIIKFMTFSISFAPQQSPISKWKLAQVNYNSYNSSHDHVHIDCSDIGSFYWMIYELPTLFSATPG